jgi:hypothetical protein
MMTSKDPRNDDFNAQFVIARIEMREIDFDTVIRS